jgi:tetratricopeptide (TPR) repeat protein
MLSALSLGYRAALADLLYTSTVISHGVHHEEHRRFEYVGQYLDSIIELDPYFCQPYRYADTLIIYQAIGNPSVDDIRHARRILEKGLEMCPTDGHLWLSAGQFMAYIGVQFLTSGEEKAAFRLAGAKMLARAAELVTDNQNAQWQTLGAAGIFTQEGQREAAIAFLDRVYRVTDDPELRENVLRKLQLLREEKRFELLKRHAEAFSTVWERDLPFVSATGVLVLGPPYDKARCAGEYFHLRDCARSWAEWGWAEPAP